MRTGLVHRSCGASPHIHALVSEGVFLPDGTFLPLPNGLLPGAMRNFQFP